MYIIIIIIISSSSSSSSNYLFFLGGGGGGNFPTYEDFIETYCLLSSQEGGQNSFR